MSVGLEVSLRDGRKPGHFWVDNEVADCYQDIVGADAVWVYCRIARYAHGAWIVSPKVRGAGDTRVGLREMAGWCGKSVDTVWRCLQVLGAVGLIQAQWATKSKGRYALADVKDLVLQEGGSYDRESGCFQLPAARVAVLKEEVRRLRGRLARKTSGLQAVEAAAVGETSVALSDSLGGGNLSAPDAKCDRSVAPSDTTVAPGAVPSITTKLQDCETPPCPQREAPGEMAGDLPGNPAGETDGGGVEAALDRLMEACGFTAARLRKKLRRVMLQRMRITGKPADDVALEMADAWQRQAAQGIRLFKHYPAAEFFEGGYCWDSNTWNWDRAYLREERLQAGAKAGSWG